MRGRQNHCLHKSSSQSVDKFFWHIRGQYWGKQSTIELIICDLTICKIIIIKIINKFNHLQQKMIKNCPPNSVKTNPNLMLKELHQFLTLLFSVWFYLSTLSSSTKICFIDEGTLNNFLYGNICLWSMWVQKQKWMNMQPQKSQD